MNTIAVYPGSFDPITNGHLDIVARAAAVFDTVIIGVLANPRKSPLLPVETRIEVIRAALTDGVGPMLDQVEVEAFDGLTVDFCRAHRANAIVRGLRAISDFEIRDAAGAQQPRPGARCGHGLLHDLGRERLRQLEPGQGDRELRRRCLVDDPGGGSDCARAGVGQPLTSVAGVPYLEPACATRPRPPAWRALRSTSSSSSSASNPSSPTARSCRSPRTSSSTRTRRSA